MATTRFQSGGALQTGEPLNLTGDASNFINAPTIGGTAQVPGTSVTVGTTDTQTLTNKTLTSPTITGGTITSTGAALTAPVITGAATVASGASITTPTMSWTTAAVTATGATGGTGAVMPTVYPAMVTITGATGSGVDLLTGPAGQVFGMNNVAAATMRIYCVGGTINGTTGTTAYTITNTGNKMAWAFCTSATGAWFIAGNT